MGVVGAIGTIVGAALGADATSDAADAQTKAANDSIALQKAQYDNAQKILDPYQQAGNKAQAYLNALYYPTRPGAAAQGGGVTATPGQPYVQGSYGAPANRVAASGSTPADYAAILGAAPTRPTPESGIIDLFTGRRRDAQSEYQQQLKSYNDRKAALDAYMKAPAEDAPTAGDVYAAINQNPYAVQGAQDLAANNALVAQQYAARQGFTNQAIADRARLADLYAGQGIDRIAGTVGITGQTGKAARAAQDLANQQALEYADTVRGYRNQDFDPYSSGQLAAQLRYQGARGDAIDNTLGYYQSQASRGYDAALRKTSAGANYADAAGQAYANAGKAQAAAGNQIGNIWGQAGQSVASQITNAYGYGKQKTGARNMGYGAYGPQA